MRATAAVASSPGRRGTWLAQRVHGVGLLERLHVAALQVLGRGKDDELGVGRVADARRDAEVGGHAPALQDRDQAARQRRSPMMSS
jgi:hypothetical protein